MRDVKHPCPVGGSVAGKPKSFYFGVFFLPLSPTPSYFLSLLIFLKRADPVEEGRKDGRASFTVHCFEELRCNLDWQRGPSCARG